MKTDKRIIKPFKIKGSIQAMTSKSYLQRALLIAAIAKGPSTINNIRWSEDGLAAHDILLQLGVKTEGKNNITITPSKIKNMNPLEFNVRESGLSMRLFSAWSMTQSNRISITGKGSILKRSIEPMLNAMDKMHVKVKSKTNSLPITIQGPMTAGEFDIDCSSGSQFLSGLLIALPLLKRDSILNVKHLTSKPYIDMTMEIMRDFGVRVEHNQYERFSISGNQKYIGSNYTIEGDWSAIANFLVGAAISGSIKLTNINTNSLQADLAIVKVLAHYGANVAIAKDEITISHNEHHPFEFDAVDCPDLFPPLVVLAASAVGKSIIKGTHRLLNKESNRLETLIATFSILGLKMETYDDQLIIHGTGKLIGGQIDSHNDHRIAMAGCMAAILCKDPIGIKSANSIDKSYPDFYKDLASLIK